MELYDTLQFVHVVAAIVWVGGVVSAAVLNARAARQPEPAVMMVRHTRFLGQAVIGPAAGVTLLVGVATAAQAGISFGSLWLVWGLSGVVLSLGLGATVIRRTNERLEAALADGEHPQVGDLRRRLQTWGLANVGVLMSVVWAMVAKPTL